MYIILLEQNNIPLPVYLTNGIILKVSLILYRGKNLDNEFDPLKTVTENPIRCRRINLQVKTTIKTPVSRSFFNDIQNPQIISLELKTWTNL